MNPYDFDDEQQLQSTFAEAVRSYAPPVEFKETVRNRLFSEAASRSVAPRPWSRRLMTRRILVGAITASLTAAAIAWLSLSGIALESVALAEFKTVLENSDPGTWVHFFEGDGRELWVSYDPYRYYSRSARGLFAIDRSANREYQYDAAMKTLTVSYAPLPSGMTPDMFGSYGEFVLDKIKDFEQSGLEIRKGTDIFHGLAVTVYVVTGTRDGVAGTIKYYFDPRTNRVVGGEKTVFGPFKHQFVVDYLANGPADLHAIGVPQDARVIDQTPGPEVLDLLRKLERPARWPFYQVSVSILQSFSEKIPPPAGATIEVTYYQNECVRRDAYNVPCPHSLSREQANQYLEELRREIPLERLESLEGWLGKHKPNAIHIWDAHRGKTMEYMLDRSGNLDIDRGSSRYMASLLVDGVWGLPVDVGGGKPALIKAEGRWGKLLGIENRRNQRFYFNPERDYLCEKAERHFDAGDSAPARTDSTEVLEYGKTPGGHWFRKQIQKIDYGGRETSVVVNFKDETRSISPGVFDGNKITAQDLVPFRR